MATVAWNELELRGWGGVSRVRSLASRPERVAEVADALAAAAPGTVLARGAGRSYGDQSLNSSGRTILTERLDRLVSFDEASGELVCEPGVTFKTLLDVFLPRGFLFPVSPGTAFTTVGGAVANDVHGKNHDHAGSFGDHVLWLDMVTPSGDTLRCSPDERADLFTATIAGCGLTGVIVRVCFRMTRVPSGYVDVRTRKLRDLDAFMAAYEECRDQATYSVGWFDGLAKGANLGRGLLQTAEFAFPPLPPSPPPPRAVVRRGRPRVPFDLPNVVLNPLSVRLFNEAYFRAHRESDEPERKAIAPFLYPLDGIEGWNHMYGRRGFFQFQAVVPDAEAEAGIRRLVEEIVRSEAGSFLNVLKTLGGEGRGLLSFPMRGYTLAMDFPNAPGVAEVLKRLERITLEHGGRVYLGKDALLSAESFRQMYPRHAKFQEVVDGLDPEGRLSSDMARRLEMRR